MENGAFGGGGGVLGPFYMRFFSCHG